MISHAFGKSKRSFGNWIVAGLFLVVALPRVHGEPTVRVGKPWRVAPPSGGGGNFIEKLADGTVITDVLVEGDKAVWHLSRDGGKTWTAGEIYERGFRPTHPCSLSDGTILAYGVFPNKKPKETRLPQHVAEYHAWYGRRTNASLKSSTCRVDVPNAVSGTGDAIDWDNPIEGMVFYSPKLIEMPGGRLLATMYGWLGDSLVPMTDLAYIAGADKLGVKVPNQYCSIVVESIDRGRSWRYVSTIARGVAPKDPAGKPIGTEGPCEPSMARTADGDLVTVMRTGRRAPMFQARSTDGGRTWEKARQMDVYGVAPHMLTMEDGTLACAYGTKEDWRRPREIHVLFSFDGGHTWPINTLVYKGEEVSSYPAICEVEPGVLLVSYSPYMPSDKARQVSLVRLTVGN